MNGREREVRTEGRKKEEKAYLLLFSVLQCRKGRKGKEKGKDEWKSEGGISQYLMTRK